MGGIYFKINVAFDNIHERIKEAAVKRLLFLPHTIRQISRPERMITTKEIQSIVMTGEVIEDYPEDTRGHSCLILGFGQNNRVSASQTLLTRGFIRYVGGCSSDTTQGKLIYNPSSRCI
jgi:hypothetical protein